MGKLTAAAKTNDRRKILIALRDRLAATLEKTSSGRDVAALSKRLMEVTEELDALPDPDAVSSSPIQRQQERVAKRRGQS